MQNNNFYLITSSIFYSLGIILNCIILKILFDRSKNQNKIKKLIIENFERMKDFEVDLKDEKPKANA